MIVTDASALTAALVIGGDVGQRARAALRRDAVAAPELIDLETLSAIRGLVRSGQVAPAVAEAGLADLAAMPFQRASHRHLVARCWELRDNLTPYDASYVALAELLGATLLTADRRLAGAPNLRCRVELLS